MSDLNERTRIPLFAVIVSLPFLAGGVLWLASIDSKATAASDEVKGLKPLVTDIHDRVIRIEEHQKLNKKEYK